VLKCLQWLLLLPKRPKAWHNKEYFHCLANTGRNNKL